MQRMSLVMAGCLLAALSSPALADDVAAIDAICRALSVAGATKACEVDREHHEIRAYLPGTIDEVQARCFIIANDLLHARVVFDRGEWVLRLNQPANRNNGAYCWLPSPANLELRDLANPPRAGRRP